MGTSNSHEARIQGKALPGAGGSLEENLRPLECSSRAETRFSFPGGGVRLHGVAEINRSVHVHAYALVGSRTRVQGHRGYTVVIRVTTVV